MQDSRKARMMAEEQAAPPNAALDASISVEPVTQDALDASTSVEPNIAQAAPDASISAEPNHSQAAMDASTSADPNLLAELAIDAATVLTSHFASRDTRRAHAEARRSIETLATIPIDFLAAALRSSTAVQAGLQERLLTLRQCFALKMTGLDDDSQVIVESACNELAAQQAAIERALCEEVGSITASYQDECAKRDREAIADTRAAKRQLATNAYASFGKQLFRRDFPKEYAKLELALGSSSSQADDDAEDEDEEGAEAADDEEGGTGSEAALSASGGADDAMRGDEEHGEGEADVEALLVVAHGDWPGAVDDDFRGMPVPEYEWSRVDVYDAVAVRLPAVDGPRSLRLFLHDGTLTVCVPGVYAPLRLSVPDRALLVDPIAEFDRATRELDVSWPVQWVER